MRDALAVTAFLVLLGAGEADAAGRWSVRAGTGGEILASVENRAGSMFGIACTAGAARKDVSLQYETEAATLGRMEPIAVGVGADEFRFVLDGMSGIAVTAGADGASRLKALSERIVAARGGTITVRLVDRGTSETFPLTGARAAIGRPGRGVLEGCVR